MLLLVGVGILFLSLALWLGSRLSEDRAEQLWAAAWCTTLASGIALELAPPFGTTLVAYLGPLFPAGQLAGALAYARGRAPGWIAPLALGLGLTRAASVTWGFEGLVTWVPLAIEPAATLAAAFLLHREAVRAHAHWTLFAAAWLLPVAAAADFFTAWSLFSGELTPGLGVVWLGLVVVGMPLQLYLALNRDNAYRANLQFRTEAELAESRHRFQAIAESAFDLIAELDGDEHLTYVNPRYEEVLGYTREQLIGHHPVEFVHPDDLEAARRFAARAGEADVAPESVIRARRSDGSYLWLEHVARSYLAPDGTRRWVMNSRDVSERVAREELRERDHERLEETAVESEERFRVLTEQAPELIAELDAQGLYTFANDGFRELLGRDPKTLIGTTPERLVHPEDVEASRGKMVEALRTGGRTQIVHRFRHADGTWRWFENTGRAYRSRTGALRFVAIARDVTETRRQEEERRELEHRMREVQRLDSLGALAGGIAHDFNNLLAVILGNLTMLETAELSAEARARLSRIRSAAAHAEALTDQMLTYAGKSVVDLAPLDLSKLVAETGDLLRATVSDRGRLGIELALDLDPDLPSVFGDDTQLRQVLLNLVANAAEALGQSHASGSVRVRTDLVQQTATDLEEGFGASERPPGAWVLLEVSDDGPGMYAALRTRIFEPFFTTRASGRGLGLSAVLGIAGAHGGVLKLDSTPGLGTTFRLLLRPSNQEAVASQKRPAYRPARKRGACVLVVDDDEAVREVAQLLLERSGFRVRTAPGGNAAVAVLESSGEIDAVLLDLEMPGLAGPDLIEELRREHPELPIVVASGYKRDLAADRLPGSHPHGFVQKPFDPDALVAALNEALGRED